MEIRNDITGLRGLSVLIIFFYHYNHKYLSGGLIGVDTFFVITGFFITKSILDSYQLKKFSILNYYANRVKRILPVCYCLWIFLTCFYNFNMENDMIYDIIYSIIGLINYRFYSLSLDYLSSENRESLLLHFWTLSLQQQFYFIYPLYIIAFYKLFKLSLIIVSLISFLLCCYYSVYEVSYSYFSFATRFWEIGFGAIFYILYSMKIHSKNWTVYVSIFVILLFACYFNSEIYSYPSYITLIPVICSCTIINSVNNDNNFLLLNRILIISGTISYSIYVIHYPILQILNTYSIVYLIIITYLVSYVIYINIEKRCSKILYSPILIVILSQIFNVIFIFILVKLNIYNKNHTEFVFDEISGFNKFMNMQKTFLSCNLNKKTSSFLNSYKFVLLGDCHVQQWIPILSKFAFQHGYIVFHIYYWSYYIERGKYNEVFSILKSIGYIKAIFLSQFLGYKPYMVNYSKFSINFKEYLGILYKNNYTNDIFVIQNTGNSRNSVKQYLKNMKDTSFGYIGINFTQNLIPSIQGIKIIDMNSYICRNKRCPFIIDGFVVYADKHHLNPAFVAHLYYKFLHIMNKKYEKIEKVSTLKSKGYYSTVICCNNKWKIANRKCMIKGD